MKVVGILWPVVATLTLVASLAVATDSAEQVSSIVKNSAPYAEGIALNMSKVAVVKRLGKPHQVDQPSNVEVWRLKERTLSIRFDSQDRVISYSIHWIGREDTIPSYTDLIPKGFVEHLIRGTRIVESASDTAVIRWTRAPAPSHDIVVSILSISAPQK